MKIVAILGGLGSQMFKYAFYLAVKEACPSEKCLIDTTSFLTMDMWNGYELDKIFKIHAEDLSDKFNEDERLAIKGKAYRKVSLDKIHELYPNDRISFFDRGKRYEYKEDESIFYTIKSKIIWHFNYFWYLKILKDDRHIDQYSPDYLSIEGITYYDEFNHTSDLYFHNLQSRLKDVFAFPEFCDKKNRKIADEMLKCESVALHVRRSDHMYDNVRLFEDGYFNKAVNFIKSKSKNPIFYIFSDEPSWCVENKEIIGLSESDNIVIVNWNNNTCSYRDMQLMTYCKHNILVISSFSWWGYYLSRNTNGKIVCAPDGYWFEVENRF